VTLTGRGVRGYVIIGWNAGEGARATFAYFAAAALLSSLASMAGLEQIS
jgi:hypothetical protein